ncbi:MAG: hypothetical protein K0R61_5210, partial [Microvirga sp.]|nr:hypothetical protein [Microvirga sp.]
MQPRRWQTAGILDQCRRHRLRRLACELRPAVDHGRARSREGEVHGHGTDRLEVLANDIVVVGYLG